MPEDNHFHEVRGAAREDEGAEQPEDRGEWNVAPPHHEIRDDARDGKIRSPDGEVGKDVQPAVGCAPIAAIPASGETFRVEQVGEEIQHMKFRQLGIKETYYYRDVRSGVVRALPTL